MDGLNHLKYRKSEPEVLAAINERFGSMEQLYMKLFELNFKVYQLTKQIPDEYEYWRTEFHERIYQELEPEKDAEFLTLMNKFQSSKTNSSNVKSWAQNRLPTSGAISTTSWYAKRKRNS